MTLIIFKVSPEDERKQIIADYIVNRQSDANQSKNVVINNIEETHKLAS